MKKNIVLILFLSSCTEANFPYDVQPFDNQERLLKECAVDSICGEYSYETGIGETGDATIFKQKDTYYIHYTRDDDIEYIGIGVLSSNYLAITYIPWFFRCWYNALRNQEWKLIWLLDMSRM